jgi:hypothetical protein
MTSGNKLEIDLLQAHYSGLEQRIEELETQAYMLNQAVHTLLGGGDMKRLRLVREDRTPKPRQRNKDK